MGRHLNELLIRVAEEQPSLVGPGRRRRIEERDGLIKPARRPTGTLDVNPLLDPLARIKRPLRALNGPIPGSSHVEFKSWEIIEIRHKFHATQKHFARMFG